MADYVLLMTNSEGLQLGDHLKPLRFVASQIANNVGRLELNLPADYNRSFIVPDGSMIQVWRAPDGGKLSLWNTYMVDGFEFATLGGKQTIAVSGADMMNLLERRKIPYYTDTAYTDKSGPADDIIKEWVDEQLVNPVLYSATGTPDTDRDLSAWLSIAADLSDGPTVEKRASWANWLLSTCQRISQMAREAGTEIFFMIEPAVIGTNTITWRFVTRTGQPGADLTSGANQVVFSQERKNMLNPSYSEDWADSQNAIYSAGSGKEAARLIATATDSTRALRGIYARREGYIDTRGQGDDLTRVQDAANGELEEQRPVIKFTAQPISIAGSVFGTHWNFGDKVVAKYLNYEFDCIIRAVQIAYTPGNGETINTRLDWRNE